MTTKQRLKTALIVCLTTACTTNQLEEKNVLKISGSDTEFALVESLANSYNTNNELTFEVKGGGTSIGIQEITDNKVDIANCSREINEIENHEAKKVGINLVPAIFAVDAIAIITHPSNTVDSLSTLQLQAIFSGDIINWKELGGPDRRINIHGRNENSGTYSFLLNKFVPNQGFYYKTIQEKNNQDILEAIKKDTFALGYVGAGFLMDVNGKPNSDIWAMYLYTEGEKEACSPYQRAAITQGKYPLVRPLYQYFDGIPEGKIADFLSFELSFEGQNIIQQHGFFAISPALVAENRKNGIIF